ncbi:MAG: protein kinase [Elusimicrobia bacterium]|nr:protein kinase [Elusimicrobiota bacterium]
MRPLFLAAAFVLLCPGAFDSSATDNPAPAQGQQPDWYAQAQQNLTDSQYVVDKYETRKRDHPVWHFFFHLNPFYVSSYKECKGYVQTITTTLNSDLPDDQKAAVLVPLDPKVDKAVDTFKNPGKGGRGEGGGGGGGWGKVRDFDKKLSDAVEQDPGDSDGMNLSAQTKMGKGDFGGAASDASRAIAMGGGADAFATRAAANAGLKDYKAAESDAQQALNMDPNNQFAFQTLQLSKGRSGGSEAGGETGTSQAGGGAGGGFARSMSMSRTAPFVKPQPTNVTMSAEWARKAQQALTLKDYKAAIAYASNAISLNPQNAQAFNFRAMAHNQMKNYRDAARDADEGLKLAPGNVPLLNTKAFALNRLKDYRGAFEAAQQAVSINPGSADAYANLAHSLGGMGDRQGMIDNLKRAAALDPRYQSALDMAVQAPKDSDILFLFPGEEGQAPLQAAAPEGQRQRKGFSVVAVAAVIGGFLIALGLLRGLGPGPWRTLKSKLSRLSTPRPAASEIPLDLGIPMAAPQRQGSPALGGQYWLVREIGVGGMGMVYEGKDRTLERRVAIKKMRPEIRDDARERERFLAEAKVVAALKHPGIVEIYSIVEEDGEVYLIFEFVEGKTLFDLSHQSTMPVAQVLKYYRDIASALDYAHSKKVIHRDLKPSNIMIDAEGRARVMDFGVARVAKDAMTRVAMTQTVLGTPPYMAPEQEQGMVAPQGDVYSMAVCLYETLSGRLPFTGTGAGLLMNKMSMSFRPISQLMPGLPNGVDAVFSRAFSTDLAKRYAKAADIMAELEGLVTAARRPS